MTYEQLKALKPRNFKRAYDVYPLCRLMKLLTRLCCRRSLQDKSPSTPLALCSAGGRGGPRLAEVALPRGHDVTGLAADARRVALAQPRRAKKGQRCYDKCVTYYDVIR